MLEYDDMERIVLERVKSLQESQGFPPLVEFFPNEIVVWDEKGRTVYFINHDKIMETHRGHGWACFWTYPQEVH